MHLLLALAREDEGLATEVLNAYTVDYELLSTLTSSSPIKRKKRPLKNPQHLHLIYIVEIYQKWLQMAN